jgi:hypothetical protein
MKNNTQYIKHIYWIPGGEFIKFKNDLNSTEFKIKPVKKTSCETLNAKNKIVRYASPKIFSGLCNRQGSWYRASNKAGGYLVVSEERLPEKYNQFLDSTIIDTDFSPQTLPDQFDIKKLVDSEEYQSQRPDDWEKKTFKDGLMYKIFFTLTGFWGFGDNFAKHWNNHRANHANFLTHRYTTDIDDESIPYSVTNNDGVCSSCVEFFNIIDQDSRKMVRACPGSVYFSSVERKKYYDVQPVKFTPSIGS